MVVFSALMIGIAEDDPTEESLILPLADGLQKVEVISAKTSSQTININAHGIVEARWVSEINARVSGYVEEVSHSLRRGRFVTEGETLIKLADLDYRVAVSEAELALASANTALLTEKEKYKQAQRDIKVLTNSKGENSASVVALRIPQLAEAEANVRARQISLEKATRDLEFTQLTAPFSGVILDYEVSKAEWVEPGEDVLKLADITELFINVPLSADKWKLLDQSQLKEGISVDIRIPSYSNKNWRGIIRDYIPAAEKKTGNLTLIVDLLNDTDEFSTEVPLNSYANISFAASQVDNVVRVPESGLVNTRAVWAVDGQNRVRHLPMEILQYQKKEVLIRYEESDINPKYIIVKASGKLIEGQQIDPKIKDVFLTGAR